MSSDSMSQSISDEDSDFDMDVEEGTEVGSVQVSVQEPQKPQNIKAAKKEESPESSEDDFSEDENDIKKSPPAILKNDLPKNNDAVKEPKQPIPQNKQSSIKEKPKESPPSLNINKNSSKKIIPPKSPQPAAKDNNLEKSKEAVKKSLSHSELDFGDIVTQKSEHKENIDVDERFYKYQEKVKEKVDKIAKDLNQEKFKECTFKPTINGEGSKRSIDEFVSEMQNYEKRKQDKINTKREENIKTQSLTERNFQPAICEKSLQILAQKGESSEPVHEKLFKMKKSESSKQVKKIKEEQEKIESSQFKPTLNPKSQNLIRADSIEKILYDDAVRRIHKEPEGPTLQKEKFISSKSEQVLIIKFKKEFEEAFSYLDSDNQDKLNYSNTLNLLQKLFFIKNSLENPKNDEEKLLVLKMWRLLGGNDSEFITKRNLEIFTMGLMNYYHPQMSSTIDQSSSITSSIGRLVDGEFALFEDEVAKLHRTFFMFYNNRAQQTQHSNVNPTYKNKVEYSFHPQINNSSNKLADGARLKRTESLGSKTTHEDYLISERQKIDEKINKLKKEYEQENRKECTFKPMINKKPGYKMAEKTQKDTISEEYKKISEDPNEHRSIALYNLSEVERKRKEQIFRTAEEMEIEKEQAECTFRPNLEKPVISSSTDVLKKKGVAETVNRMRKAREEQELIKSMKERGFTNKGELKPLNSDSERPKSSLSHSQSQTLAKPPLPSSKFKQQRDSLKILKQQQSETNIEK